MSRMRAEPATMATGTDGLENAVEAIGFLPAIPCAHRVLLHDY